MTKNYQMPPTVPLARLELHLEGFTNPRTASGISKTEVEEMAADIHEEAQRHGDDGEITDLGQGIRIALLVLPCTVPGDKKVHFLVIDGQRRYLGLQSAAKDLKISAEGVNPPVQWAASEPVELTAGEADKQIAAALSIACKRVGLSSYELTMAAQKLRDRGMSMDEIGAAVGHSHTWVSRMLGAVTKAEPQLVVAWSKGKIPDEAFKDLAQVHKAVQGDALRDTLDAADKDRESKGKARAAAKEKAEKPKGKAGKDGKGKGKDAAPARTATVVLAELVSMGRKNRPKDPYVRGIIDGAAYSLGETSADDLGAEFLAWMKGIAAPGKKKSP